MERINDDDYKVILLDMKLPDGDGGHVFRMARRSAPGPQIVVITGHRAEMERKVQQVLSEGASAVLHKPFDVPALLATLRQLTGAEPNQKLADGNSAWAGQVRH